MTTLHLKICPFCRKQAVFIGVHDDEGNYHGPIGCEYEEDAWSGLSYALHHEGWGDCILCTDGTNGEMGGVLFDTAEEAADEWNKGLESENQIPKAPEMKAMDGFAPEVASHLCCPTCGGPVTNYWVRGTVPKHCQFCGQALDWERRSDNA
jgi:hypothetical protein